MEIDLQQAYDAYAKLSDEEKEIIRKVMTGPEREILKKVFGLEFVSAMGNFVLPLSKRGKGLASKS
tara:strand:+ start:2616 stop:2813 length:198 start_codon:yes stop_codon:yes gene_type:complete